MLQADAQRVILASQSAARAALLTGAGVRFERLPARIDEAALKAAARAEGASVQDTALLLAASKARRVRDPDALVIGADQILVCDGRWFDKPADLDEARTHLLALRGRSHDLVTATVCARAGREVWRHIVQPRLTMRRFSDTALDAYLQAEGAALLGSVGAYRLEGPGIQLFESVDGDHSAIMGLPLLPLLAYLRQCGVLLG